MSSFFFSEIFIYRYHLSLSVHFLSKQICVSTKEVAFVPFLCYRSLSLLSDVRPSRLAGGRGGRIPDLPLFLSREGLDSSFRFWFFFLRFPFTKLHRRFSLPFPLSATQMSSFYAGFFISPSLLIQPNILCFSTHATRQTLSLL